MNGVDRMHGLELRHLAALDAVAEERSFGRAARRLGYTQSAVSHQIATLERIVGHRLVERPGGPRAVSLTEAGELLLGHARSVVARLHAAQADLDALGAGTAGSLRIGVYQSAGARILPRVLRRFASEWPRVEVRATEEDGGQLLALVERGDLDLTFTTLPLDGGPFAVAELLYDPYVLIVEADSLLASSPHEPSLDEVAELPLVAWRYGLDRAVEAAFHAAGLDPDVVFRSGESATLQGLVGAGVGAAIVPRLTVDLNDPTIVARPLTGIRPRCIGLAWHAERHRPAAARSFVEVARAICANGG